MLSPPTTLAGLTTALPYHTHLSEISLTLQAEDALSTSMLEVAILAIASIVGE